MKAVMVKEFGAPEVMVLEDTVDLRPGPGQVVVRVKAAGVNPVDAYIRSGIYGSSQAPPFTPGIDGAGIIEAVGEGVKHRRVGDRVYVAWSLTGTYAEQALCEEFQTHPLPERVSFSQGAALGVPYGTAYRALFQRGRGVPGETVLIHGASGGVGIAALQFARAAGMIVIGTAGSEKGKDLVLAQGAHYVLNHRETDHLQGMALLICRDGVDLIIEMLANANLGADLKALDKRGRIVVVGCRGTVEIDPREAMMREADILGLTLFNASEKERASIHGAIAAGLENGTLNPVVSREMPLRHAMKAHHAVIEESTFGKIVLVP